MSGGVDAITGMKKGAPNSMQPASFKCAITVAVSTEK